MALPKQNKGRIHYLGKQVALNLQNKNRKAYFYHSLVAHTCWQAFNMTRDLYTLNSQHKPIINTESSMLN
jgi:hypothetical protein